MLGNLTFFPRSPRARFLSLFRAERNRQTRNDRSHKLKERRTERETAVAGAAGEAGAAAEAGVGEGFGAETNAAEDSEG